jgi:cation diffusion facilitator family transporter
MSEEDKQQQQTEARALRLSAWAYLAMALLGGGYYYLSQSEAILLDGVYSFISLLMTFVAQRVSQLVQTPYTDRFHFGFAHFEPLLNVVRILLILAIAGFAAASAVVALLQGGRPLDADSAVIYGAIAAAGCLTMAWKQNRAARQANSPLLAVDARNWLVDGVLSSGVAVTFVIAFLLQRSAYADWVPYIDPLLVIVMIAMMVPVPLKTLGENLRQVLMQAPDEATQEKIRSRVIQAVQPTSEEEVLIRMLPVGRILYLQVFILVPRGTEVRVIDEFDAVRKSILDNTKDLHPQLTLDVMFTTDRHWVGLETAPT